MAVFHPVNSPRDLNRFMRLLKERGHDLRHARLARFFGDTKTVPDQGYDNTATVEQFEQWVAEGN